MTSPYEIGVAPNLHSVGSEKSSAKYVCPACPANPPVATRSGARSSSLFPQGRELEIWRYWARGPKLWSTSDFRRCLSSTNVLITYSWTRSSRYAERNSLKNTLCDKINTGKDNANAAIRSAGIDPTFIGLWAMTGHGTGTNPLNRPLSSLVAVCTLIPRTVCCGQTSVMSDVSIVDNSFFDLLYFA